KDLCGFSDDTTSFDSRLYALIKDFKKELHTNTVSTDIAEQLIPLIAIQGGSFAVSTITSRMKGFIYVFEKILDISILIDTSTASPDITLSSRGYASTIQPSSSDLSDENDSSIVSIDDI
ncbi:MAG: hypothetical protein ACQESC_04425, partial [Nanobdellota archaeon]